MLIKETAEFATANRKILGADVCGAAVNALGGQAAARAAALLENSDGGALLLQHLCCRQASQT